MGFYGEYIEKNREPYYSILFFCIRLNRVDLSGGLDQGVNIGFWQYHVRLFDNIDGVHDWTCPG